MLRHGVLSERFTLPDTVAVIADGVGFILQIVPQHVLRVVRCANRFGGNRRHLAEIVDLPREDQGMIELLLGVNLELRRDVHVLGAAQHLGIHDVRDDGLVFA